MWFETALPPFCFIPAHHTHVSFSTIVPSVWAGQPIPCPGASSCLSTSSLCLRVYSENMIVIKVSNKSWMLIFYTAVLWVAFEIREIASLHRIYKAALRIFWNSSRGDHIFPDFASLFISQRLLVSLLPSLPGEFCDIDSRKQKLM